MEVSVSIVGIVRRVLDREAPGRTANRGAKICGLTAACASSEAVGFEGGEEEEEDGQERGMHCVC